MAKCVSVLLGWLCVAFVTGPQGLKADRSNLRIAGPRTVGEGETLTLTCKVTGMRDQHDVDWFRDGSHLTSNVGERLSIGVGRSSSESYTSYLQIDNVQMADAGTYVCRTMNDVGSLNVHVLRGYSHRNMNVTMFEEEQMASGTLHRMCGFIPLTALLFLFHRLL